MINSSEASPAPASQDPETYVGAAEQAQAVVARSMKDLLAPPPERPQRDPRTRDKLIRAGQLLVVHEYDTLGAVLKNTRGVATELGLEGGHAYHRGPYVEHSRKNQQEITARRKLYGAITIGRPYSQTEKKIVDTPGKLAIYVDKEAFIKAHGVKKYESHLKSQKIKPVPEKKPHHKWSSLKIVK